MRIGILTPSRHTFHFYDHKIRPLKAIMVSRIDDLRGREWDRILLCHDSFLRKIPSDCFEFIHERGIKTIPIDDFIKTPI